MEGAMQRMAGRGALPLVYPLVVPVEVDADEIEQIGRAAEFRFGEAGEHIPGFELRVRVGEDRDDVFGLRGVGDDADEGFRLDEAGGGVGLADGVGGGDAGAHEVALELRTAAGAKGKEVLHIATDPGPEGDLVDRAEEGRRSETGGAAAIANEDGGGVGEGGEALDKGGGEGIEAFGNAPVAEVPDDLGV